MFCIKVIIITGVTCELKLLSLLYSHGFPEHTETTSMDSVPLAPVGAVDKLILSGHWQTST